MRKFSRWMPPAEESSPMGAAGWLIVAALLVVPVAAAFAWPVLVGIGVGVIVVMGLGGNLLARLHLRDLVEARPGEDIGTFARAFDRRAKSFDPWVVRATWDALRSYVTFRRGRFPLRPGDRLAEDLFIDPEEVEDLTDEIARRAGRASDKFEANPMFGSVRTVGDFVQFIALQPRAAGRREPVSDQSAP